jgi:hypothetical protein
MIKKSSARHPYQYCKNAHLMIIFIFFFVKSINACQNFVRCWCVNFLHEIAKIYCEQMWRKSFFRERQFKMKQKCNINSGERIFCSLTRKTQNYSAQVNISTALLMYFKCMRALQKMILNYILREWERRKQKEEEREREKCWLVVH